MEEEVCTSSACHLFPVLMGDIKGSLCLPLAMLRFSLNFPCVARLFFSIFQKFGADLEEHSEVFHAYLSVASLFISTSYLSK